MRTSPAHRASPPPPRRRRAVALFALMTGLAVALVGSAGATHSTTDTTAVTVVPLSPAKTVLSGTLINPGVTKSVAVIDGTTTVPSNATTVRLETTVTGVAAGTVELFPAGNPAGGAGHTISWNANQIVTQVTQENVGFKNMVSIKNLSTKTAKVTMKITGYSTQVTAGDINSSGGSVGQVLTDVGAGATWQTPANKAFRGTGSATVPGSAFVSVAAVTVPAGSYAVSYSGEFENQAPTVNTANCLLMSPGGQLMARTRGTLTGSPHSESISLVGLGNTTGGTYVVQCQSLSNVPGRVFDSSLVAIQVGSAGGAVATFKAPAR